MRIRASLAVSFTLFAVVTGCALEGADDEAASSEDAIHADKQEGPATAFAESVQVLMPNGRDFCTGVLVSSTRVVTAAHCLVYDRSWTEWTIRATLAPGAPSRKARLVGVLSNAFDDPSQGDVGVLELTQPITLAAYAIPTDIGASADRGTVHKGVAVGRARTEREAPLVRSRVLDVASAKDHGYPTGLRTAYYSGGGDSGGGLFLVENGRPTHKLVGVERNPAPERGVDYFTRVDGAMLALIAKPRGEGGSTGNTSAPPPAPTTTSTAPAPAPSSR
jgi:hypothetical protein